MDLLIVAPAVGSILTGNRSTAAQWTEQLRQLGHRVQILESNAGQNAEALIALHAEKCHEAITAFHRAHPESKIIVATTGTDIYPQPSDEAIESLRIADRIVALQTRAREKIPSEFHDKLRIIVQSAAPAPPTENGRSIDPFEICVVSHLREIKDPLRAAAAARLLPPSSRIRVRQAGAILDSRFGERLERERKENDRYVWLGELSAADTMRLIAESQLLVSSSFHEGGARVIGEAVVAGTPVLAARNDAACSLLGDTYAGLYDAGETRQLADLMARAETDHAFLTTLREQTRLAAPQFEPRRESEAWRALIEELEETDGNES
ncbi:MAG: selenoneine biosynthesis selenosugar synthase SenB [Planctomycetota bacterium]|jgi:putative glycosyltransferase (TIGR04348 family)